MKKFVYCSVVCIILFLTGCSRENNAIYRDNSIDNQSQLSVQESHTFSETEDYGAEPETEEISEYDVNVNSVKQDSGKLYLLHESEWYPYEDITFEEGYENAGSHDFMNSRRQGFPLRVYTELTFILYDYCQKISENLLTDGWTVERIIPIGDEYYNVLMYQETSGSSVDLLFDYSEPEYKVLYLQDGNMPFSLETHYMSQFDWEPFDREEKVTVADRVDNPFEDIYDTEEDHCLNVIVAAYEKEKDYAGQWKVQEFYGDSPCFSGLLVSDDRKVWICMNVGSHEYIAETFYCVNE